MSRVSAIVLVIFAYLCVAGCSRPGAELRRRGDEIMVCGRLFHTGAPVVLWTDPGGYDAYRTEKRFVPWQKAEWQAPTKVSDGAGSPNRYGIRYAPRPPYKEGEPFDFGPLTEDEFERVRGGGWDLDLLRKHVDQFVLHYDVCGVSRQCFRVLHDMRGLSVQFMLDIDGTIYQTMDLKDKAWQATIANNRSVGIEIANIGAYGEGEKDPFAQWYAMERVSNFPDTGETLRTRITIPARLGDGGVRTPCFVGYTVRPEPVVGPIHGRVLRQYDLTEQQYRSLVKLTAALHRVLPRIELDYPRDDDGKLVATQLSKERFEAFHGVLGHYHIQKDKVDPGPAMEWDRLINGARAELGMKTLAPGAERATDAHGARAIGPSTP